jgi:hypothetical protein
LVGKMINPDDPYNLYNLGTNDWLHRHTQAADDTGEDMEAGNENNAGPNDATIIAVHAARNAALAGRNDDDTDGGVGVFGRSLAKTRSIGVGGQSETGCGVYGIATAGNTIGVAGRAMSGTAVEDQPLEQLASEPIGVLGQATRGFGVRGHAGNARAASPTPSVSPSWCSQRSACIAGHPRAVAGRCARLRLSWRQWATRTGTAPPTRPRASSRWWEGPTPATRDGSVPA